MITKSGLYEWNVIPFGLKNATNTFSHTMANIFKEWTTQFLKVFVDDINIHNSTWVEYLHHIRLVLQKLAKANLKLNSRKCYFGSKNINFLKHVVDYTGFQLDPKKVTVVKSFLTPKTVTNVKAFLGLTRYYRRFIVGYAKITKPFFALTNKDCKFVVHPSFKRLLLH